MTKLLDTQDLAEWLGKSAKTIKSDLCRCPHMLPPGFKVGREWRWRQKDVEAWIEAQARAAMPKFSPPAPAAAPRRPGRPTKAEQIARRTVPNKESR